MRVSLGELAAALAKAARGAGWAEDAAAALGAAAARRAAEGGDGLAEALDALAMDSRGARAAPGAFDLACATGAARLAPADLAPGLLAAFAALAGETYGCGFEVRLTAGAAEIRRTPARPAPPAPAEGARVDPAAWERALRLAARSFVAASAESRARGAGAAISDND